MHKVTFEEVKHREEINTYIKTADVILSHMGFTEHSFAHVNKTANTAYTILKKLGYKERTAELARIAGYMHDIGNVINRIDHAQSGAIMAFRILDHMGMGADEISIVISAIGNHDEGTAVAVNEVAAALILADKSDVRRSRVRNRKIAKFDIHDRVNYSVTESYLDINAEAKTVVLNLKVDISICPVTDYFEIFLNRMLLCRRAAEALHLRFGLIINDAILM